MRYSPAGRSRYTLYWLSLWEGRRYFRQLFTNFTNCRLKIRLTTDTYLAAFLTVPSAASLYTPRVSFALASDVTVSKAFN